jgi:ubiquinone/menaquinone biosynthesis C-methylase UbiE
MSADNTPESADADTPEEAEMPHDAGMPNEEPDIAEPDIAEQRRASAAHWEEAAAGWRHRQQEIRVFGEPVSQWLVQALDPQPGQRILELAAGLGETGFRAAELVAPVGSVLITDQAEAMLEGARERAQELGLSNVEFKAMGAEWIDLPVASIDAVLCRWGYMLMTDPPAALSETRRVLRPGGRVALAVWDTLEHNPWAQVPGSVLAQRGLIQPPAEKAGYEPGPFALGEPGRIGALLEEAGFTEVVVEAVAVQRRQRSFAEFWETTLDISRSFHDAVLSRPPAEIEEIRAAVQERLAPYTAADGSLTVPGSSLVALATA